MGIWKRLFGKTTATQGNVNLEDLKEDAERIVSERRSKCIALASEQGLSREEMLPKYIDAKLGSVDVFVERFGLSLDSAVALYCTTSSGRSESKEDILELLKKIGHPLADTPHLSSQTVQTSTGPVTLVQGQCSSCGRAGLGTIVGAMVMGSGQKMLDYALNRVWVCTGCKAVFCPDCTLKKYDFKCPVCGNKIES